MKGRVEKDKDGNLIVVYYKECVEDSEAVIQVCCKFLPGVDRFLKVGDKIEFELEDFPLEGGGFTTLACPIIKVNPHVEKVISINEEIKPSMQIVLSEHCFGGSAYVDGVDITETHEGLFDPKQQKDARIKLLTELGKNIDNIPAYYWKELAEMVVQGNTDFEEDKEKSYHDTCEQCGNWNYEIVYNKK